MANGITGPARKINHIEVRDIYGLWEVIRIYREGISPSSYPWLKGRFKFNFLEEMTFMCMKDGQHSHGTWELTETIHESGNRYFIILNGTFEYVILNISEDEIVLSDHTSNYLLVRKL